MKLKDIALNEGWRREADEARIDDILRDAWDDHYYEVYDEVKGMVEELAHMYPDNPKAKKAQKYFMNQFEGLDNARVHEQDYSEKFIHYVLGTDFGSNEIPFETTVKRLKEFDKWLHDIDVYYEWQDIQDREHDDERFDYGAPYDPYSDRGLKRSDF